MGLNLAKTKSFYDVTEETFKYFAKRMGVPEKLVTNTMHNVIADVQANWPALLKTLPLSETMKSTLIKHWQRLALPISIENI